MTHKFIQHLLKDHDEQRDIAEKFANAKTIEDKRKYRKEIYDVLYPHIEGEDASIFDFLVKQGGEAKAGALEAMQEHHVDRFLLNEIMEIDIEDETLPAKARVLQEINDHHLSEEENEHFPRLEKLADDATLDRLFKQYEEKEEAIKAKRGRKVKVD